jgi:hypothetical protein
MLFARNALASWPQNSLLAEMAMILLFFLPPGEKFVTNKFKRLLNFFVLFS